MFLFFKNLLFTVFIPGTVAVYLPWIFAGSAEFVESGWIRAAAVMFFVIGAILYFWCLWNFAWIGKGTPALIDPPKKLIVRGPHRFVRNPMYLGVFSVISGWAVIFQSINVVIYGFVVALGCHCFVLLVEEPSLKRLFGAEYGEYCRKVNRWIPS